MPYRDFSLRKILVATDFSQNATSALRQAVHLADRTKAEVTLVHVIADVAGAVAGTSFEAHWRIPPADIQKAERKLRLLTGQRLDEEIALYRSPGRKLCTETRVGVPIVEIIRTAQKKRADLVVAGTRGLSRVKGFLVGSTAERLARKCPCPVWIVKSGQETSPHALLVPLDYSEVSGKSLQLAAFLAGRFDCSLNVLHVLDPSGDLSDLRLKRRNVREAAAKRLGDFVRAHVPDGMPFKELISVGTPGKELALWLVAWA